MSLTNSSAGTVKNAEQEEGHVEPSLALENVFLAAFPPLSWSACFVHLHYTYTYSERPASERTISSVSFLTSVVANSLLDCGVNPNRSDSVKTVQDLLCITVDDGREQYCSFGLEVASWLQFFSRRSPVVCTHGCVALSQMLALSIDLYTLKNSGNAVDAAVGAAVLNVTELVSTGIGGDCFCLYYDANTKCMCGVNGSGRSPRTLIMELLKEQGFDEANPLPLLHAHNITVPCAAAAWCDAISLYGSKKLSIRQLLQPAIELSGRGFPVAEITTYHWGRDAHVFWSLGNKHRRELLIDGQAPPHGQVLSSLVLASTFKELARYGKRGFYEGRIATAVVETVHRHGGMMDLEDVRSHTTDEVKPIFTNYRGVNVWEIPPNGQGITALTLNILEKYDVKGMGHNTTDYLRVLGEAMKLSFTDAFLFCADPDKVLVPAKTLSKTDAKECSRLINLQRASDKFSSENILPLGIDTMYFTVVNPQGNACSFINSNYMGFGTGLVPDGCEFPLQNRRANFSISSSHLNCLAPGKCLYHTAIPALVTAADREELLCSFGVMGGFMQLQGRVQYRYRGTNDFEHHAAGSTQQHICRSWRDGSSVPKDLSAIVRSTEGRWHLSLEDGISQAVAEDLKTRDHWSQWPIRMYHRSLFGHGLQLSLKGIGGNLGTLSSRHAQNVLWTGSDSQGNGCTVEY
ncbi:LOW QUALITY PROTEIN: glutathione hydrolase-like YwrD proenzyme [Eudromia elegans]